MFITKGKKFRLHKNYKIPFARRRVKKWLKEKGIKNTVAVINAKILTQGNIHNIMWNMFGDHCKLQDELLEIATSAVKKDLLIVER